MHWCRGILKNHLNLKVVVINRSHKDYKFVVARRLPEQGWQNNDNTNKYKIQAHYLFWISLNFVSLKCLLTSIKNVVLTFKTTYESNVVKTELGRGKTIFFSIFYNRIYTVHNKYTIDLLWCCTQLEINKLIRIYVFWSSSRFVNISL